MRKVHSEGCRWWTRTFHFHSGTFSWCELCNACIWALETNSICIPYCPLSCSFLFAVFRTHKVQVISHSSSTEWKLHFPVEQWHQWGSSCCAAECCPDMWTVRLLLQFLKAKRRSEGGFKKAEREGFADTDRQFLPHKWGATEERAWLGLFWKHCSQRKVPWLID